MRGTGVANADKILDLSVEDDMIFLARYDADGTGGAAAVLFATVSAGTALTHANFDIYG